MPQKGLDGTYIEVVIASIVPAEGQDDRLPGGIQYRVDDEVVGTSQVDLKVPAARPTMAAPATIMGRERSIAASAAAWPNRSRKLAADPPPPAGI